MRRIWQRIAALFVLATILAVPASSQIQPGGGGNVTTTPSLPLPTAGITPYISPSLESCHSAKTTPGTVISYGVRSTVDGDLMIFDQASATPPGDGPVTPAALSMHVLGGSAGVRTYSPPSTLKMLSGIMLCFSTTGPFTLTKSTTAQLEITFQ